MAAWLPILKTVLPYIGPVVQAALPHLTRKKSDKADPISAAQIAELQDAVSRNAESLRALALAMEESAKVNAAAIRRLRLIAIIAVVAAVAAAGIAIAAWLR